MNYDVAVRNLGIHDDSVLRDVFKRMNRTSYSLKDMERFNAVYLGEFKQFAEAISADLFFADVRLFSANDIRRMRDISYCASLVATMMSSYFNRDDELEDYLEQYNETFSDRDVIAGRVVATIEYIRELALPKVSRAWSKTDFFNLFIEVDRQLGRLGRKPDPRCVGQKLTALYDAVAMERAEATGDPAVKKYFEATLRNTNDRGQRIQRGDVLRELLESCPSIVYSIPANLGSQLLSRKSLFDEATDPISDPDASPDPAENSELTS